MGDEGVAMRCPTCKSDRPTVRNCGGGLGSDCPHGHEDCPDSWHTDASQDHPRPAPVVQFWDGQKYRFCPNCQSTAFKFAEAYAASLRAEVARLQDSVAKIQSHRDWWREYAYGNRPKPDDFLDGNKVDRGKTAQEQTAADLSSQPEWYENYDLVLATLQAAYSFGQTFCTAHTQVYARVQVLEERLAKAEKALKEIADWKLPGMTDQDGEPSTYEAEFGSNGVKSYMRRIAKAALTEDSNG